MIKTPKQQLNSDQRTYLAKLGLSPDAIELYELLLARSHLTAHEASMARRSFSSAEYRLFYALEALGLARHSGARPRVFEALPLQTGLSASLVRHQNELEQLLGPLRASGQEHVELLVGRQALYDRYIDLADAAQHEIWVYAIGIAYSRELVAVQRRAVKRGVSIHHIVQQVKPSNYHVVHTWQRSGVRLKYLPSERGFHLMVFDEARAVITFSNPGNTDDRLSIVTTNSQAVRLFRAHFQALWHDAKPVHL